MNERAIFMEALDRETLAERAAYLDEACGGDAELRQRVETLLTSHEQAGSFLGKPVPERLAEGLAAPDGPTETQGEPSAADGGDRLDFLTPSDKPGSLGRLGHYEVQEVIGRGGMGIVLRAFDEKLHRVAAIKVIAPHMPANGAARKRFVREARAAAAVRDEHVVGVYAVEDAAEAPYLVMEYIAGVSLQERLDRTGPLEVKEILRIGLQAASGLAAAHAQGLIHRDVKPANILLENHVERVKITDFGLARAVDDASLTQSGVIAGTPHYMAPEQARGEAVDHRADLFSLGGVLYALCTARPPFGGGNTLAVLKRVCEDAPRPIREINPDVPEWLVEIIAKLQAKDPAERFQTAREVAEVLGRELAALQRGDTERLGPPRPTPPAKRSRRQLVVAAAVLLLFAAGFVLTESIGTTHVTATVLGRFTANTPPVAKGEEGRNDVQPAEPPAPAQPDLLKPFVILANADLGEKSYETLAEAVSDAGSSDVIEIRGNGPFVSPAIPTIHGRLTIRAGVGTRPVIRWQPEAPREVQVPLNFLEADDDLILEGIEFQALAHWPFSLIRVSPAARSVRLVNCRIQLSVRNGEREAGMAGIASHCATVALRNCEVVSEAWSGRAIWMYGWQPVRQQLMLDNCVVASADRSEGCLGVANNVAKFPIDVRLTRNTFAGPVAFSFGWSVGTATRRTLPAPELYRFDCAENVFATPVLFNVLTAAPSAGPSAEVAEEQKQILAPADARRVFRDLLTWREQRNVYNSTTDFYGLRGANVRWFRSEMDLPHWADYWGQAGTSSRQGDVLLKGVTRFPWAGRSDTTTADDFRLREESAGKGIGEGGRDPGADVDLVGPGPAYERWKKTPAYQEWLKESGQKR